MKKNYLRNGRKIVSVIALATVAQTSYAQIDVTSSFLTNPDFEFADRFENWDLVNFNSAGDANGAKTQVTTEKELGKGFLNGTNAVENWVASSSSLADFDISQTVFELPAGTYEFSVGAKGLNQSADKKFNHVKGLYLYANGDSVVISTPLFEDLSNNIRSDKTWPLSQFFKVRTVLEEPGEIKFGFCAEGTDANWICFDNFKMYLVECSDMKIMYRAQIGDMLEPYTDDTFNFDIVGIYKTQLILGGPLWAEYDALEVKDDASEEEYKALYDKVLATVEAAEATRATMVSLTDLLSDAEALMENEYPGAEKMSETITSVSMLYYIETTTVEDIENAIAQLNQAMFDYKLSVTIGATSENPADITSIIVNPTLVEGSTVQGSKPTGWTCSNSGGNGTYLYFPNGTGDLSEVLFEAWSGTPANLNFDYYQDIKGLPTGIYSLKAVARGNQGTPNGNAVIYASAENEKTKGILNPVILGVGEDEALTSDYTVSDIFVAGGTLRIGFKNVGTIDNNWTICGNFELFYHGNEAGVANYQSALADRIAEAKSYNEMEMLPQEKSYLNGAIWDAEDKLTSESTEELIAAMDDLKAAVEKAKDAVNTLSKFKAGKYSSVLDFDSEDEIILEIAEKAIASVDERLTEISVSSEDLDIFSAQLDDVLSFFALHAAMTKEFDSEAPYTSEALAAFETKLSEITSSLVADNVLDLLAQATDDLNAALAALRNSIITSGNSDLDVTSWIVNPSFEDAMTGWVNSGAYGIDNSPNFEEKTGTYFVGNWVPSGSNINDATLYQTVVVPEGLYKITVDASASQGGAGVIDGVKFVAYNGDLTNAKYSVDIKSKYLVEAVVDTIYTNVVDGEGNPVIDETTGSQLVDKEPIVVSPAELTYELNIAADRGILTFGVEAANANCNWLRFDNFTLTYNGAIPAGVEDVNTESSVFVYVKEKQIIVSGADEYSVYSSNGQAVSANAELASGIYIVKVGTKSVKVVVK